MTKENTQPAGLFSKMMRFVRNPTVNWSELDSIEADRESQYSKQMLKEMIERKRRNDFVRKREFDQLRKLRQRDALAGERTEDPTARPSFFQSSMTSPDERADTLKKIDEIEAQMSQQWWRSKPGSAPPAATTTAGVVSASASVSVAQGAGANAAIHFAPTTPMAMMGAGKAAPAAQAVQPTTSHAPLLADAVFAAHTASSSSALGIAPVIAPVAPPEPEVFVHEPDLEEAAIRFASGDHAGAEAVLRDVLQQHAHDNPQQQLEIWMTLFDLYRATGQKEPFDGLSIDFAARFSRSAPLWIHLPQQLGKAPLPEPSGATAPRQFSWTAPAHMTLQSVASLQALLGRSTPPWTFAWSRIMAIEESALVPLAKLFEQWADRDIDITFNGVEALHALLQSKTLSGDASLSPDWWRLRMTALRLMGRLDEFELVALDYCVTYEVSPPSWVVPRCRYAADDGTVSAATDQGGAPDSDLMASNFGTLSQFEPEAARPILEGYIDNDASALLEPLQEMAKPNQPLVIGCEHLIRVDFPAAGSILNWAAQLQAQGQVVQFINLHRLVAVLFNVIGINEHAWVIPRKN